MEHKCNIEVLNQRLLVNWKKNFKTKARYSVS